MDPGYREHAPSRDLLPWVECLWTRLVASGDEGAKEHRVLPDGCADILFDLSLGTKPRAFVVGPMTTALILGRGSFSRVVGVRFRPGAGGAFLRAPLRQLVDRRVELAALWRDAADVTERLAEADLAAKAVRALDRELCERLGRAAPPEPQVRAAVERLAREPEGASVEALAAELGITRQHLTRRFRDATGYGPKRLARVFRLRRALRLLRSRERGGLAAIALDAGYYDQPHMNAEFRELAGAAPLEIAG